MLDLKYYKKNTEMIELSPTSCHFRRYKSFSSTWRMLNWLNENHKIDSSISAIPTDFLYLVVFIDLTDDHKWFSLAFDARSSWTEANGRPRKVAKMTVKISVGMIIDMIDAFISLCMCNRRLNVRNLLNGQNNMQKTSCSHLSH